MYETGLSGSNSFWQRNGRAALTILAVASLVVLIALNSSTTAQAAQSFDQGRAADIGVGENGSVRPTGWDQPGECIKSVQRWITAAGGRFVGGGAYAGYVNSAADLIATDTAGVLSRAAKGDVIQYTYSPDRNAYANGVHTVMVVNNNNNGTLKIVQSNVPAGSGRVSVVDNWRPAPPANFAPYLWRFGQVLADRDNFFIKTKNTGSGRVEIHSATAGSGYQNSDLHVATWISSNDADNGWFQMVGRDLFFIKTRNTGTGRIEVHTATASSGYQSADLHSTTWFSTGDRDNGWFQMVGRDLFFIKTKNVSRVEVHTATASSGYQSADLHSTTWFSTGDRDNGWFQMSGAKR